MSCQKKSALRKIWMAENLTPSHAMAHRYWSDWTPVSGQQYGYDFDNIGNRTDAKWGGDTSGSNLRTTSYSANSLNECTSITTPGYQSLTSSQQCCGWLRSDLCWIQR